MALPFQQIPESHQIDLDVNCQILQGITNTHLRRQVYHYLRKLCNKNCRERISIF